LALVAFAACSFFPTFYTPLATWISAAIDSLEIYGQCCLTKWIYGERLAPAFGLRVPELRCTNNMRNSATPTYHSPPTRCLSAESWQHWKFIFGFGWTPFPRSLRFFRVLLTRPKLFAVPSFFFAQKQALNFGPDFSSSHFFVVHPCILGVAVSNLFSKPFINLTLFGCMWVSLGSAHVSWKSPKPF